MTVMALTRAQISRAKRDRDRGGPPRALVGHGTPGAHRRHQRRGETPCDECKAWKAKAQAQWARLQKGA